jgi:hypothetical protein
MAERVGGLVAGQIGLLTPLPAWLVFVSCRRSHHQTPERILAAGLVIPMAVTLVSAFFTHPEQSWASLGHPLAAVLAVGSVQKRYSTPDLAAKKRGRAWMIALILSVSAFFALVHGHAVRPFVPLPPERDPVSRLHGWDELQKLSQHVDRADAVLCDNYGLASELKWTLRNEGIDKTIASADRVSTPFPFQRDWLLLNEKEDWGRAELQIDCELLRPLQTLSNLRADKKVVRKIEVMKGVYCLTTLYN